jgi:pyridoxal phosphate enzyme (YggS family)
MSVRQEEIATALSGVQAEIASYAATLIVVTKTYPLSDVEILAALGVSDFGENRNEEGVEKAPAVPARWHYQGEVQGKKIRSLLNWADCIHSLDSIDHAQKISRILIEERRSVDVFLQLSLDGDPARGGVTHSELFEAAEVISELPGITLLGIMCVPPVEIAPSEAFARVARIHQSFKERFPQSPSLSAGMSQDYLLALDNGATHIRVGSKILGKRLYP